MVGFLLEEKDIEVDLHSAPWAVVNFLRSLVHSSLFFLSFFHWKIFFYFTIKIKPIFLFCFLLSLPFIFLIRRKQVPTSLIWVASLRPFGGIVLSWLILSLYLNSRFCLHLVFPLKLESFNLISVWKVLTPYHEFWCLEADYLTTEHSFWPHIMSSFS